MTRGGYVTPRAAKAWATTFGNYDLPVASSQQGRTFAEYPASPGEATEPRLPRFQVQRSIRLVIRSIPAPDHGQDNPGDDERETENEPDDSDNILDDAHVAPIDLQSGPRIVALMRCDWT